ncbi:hypothetical protein IFR05_008487, partial [Cadophora sp. M221]
MPLTNAIHESLPYIDTEPSASERAAALALILAEANSDNTTTDTHPSLPPPAPLTFTPLILSELSRIESKTPITGITTTHYESQDPPSTTPNSDRTSPATLLAWRSAIQNAYTSHSYLSSRVSNLGLLEKYGKNAWLEGNRQLEDILRGLERELEVRKGEIDG